jgi:hypothetical protein
MPLHAALRYLALQSAWAFSLKRKPVATMDDLLKREMLEKLARGEVAARGRRVTGDSWNYLTAATEPIPADFWPTAFIQPFGEIVINEDERCAAARDGRFQQAPHRSYREIVLNAADVARTWPEAGKRVARRRNPAFHDALCEYSEQFSNGGGYSTEFAMRAATTETP